MRLAITIENVETGEVEEVLAGLPVARRWEQEHGEPVGAKLDAGFVGPLAELAHLAYNRKHGRTLTIDEFEERFEAVSFRAGGRSGNPSEPATAPPLE